MPNEIKVVLGFDFGLRKIGVAVGQTITKSATPLAILSANNGLPDWDLIKNLIDAWKADALVVGVPFNMDGSEQPMTHCARRFINKLKAQFKLPVFEIDERLTTREAKSEIRKLNKSQKISRMDSYAAKIILESWLNNI